MDEDKNLKDLNVKIMILSKEYSKISNLCNQVEEKAKDSSKRNLENSYNANSLTTDPLGTSVSVYSTWKRSARNKHYIIAHKKLKKILKNLKSELRKHKTKALQLKSIISKREYVKQLEKERKRGY